MELTVLGSNSKGNCYILQNSKEALIIECGVSLSEVKKAVNFNISKIVGVIVSHEHGDHSKHVNDFLDARINMRMSSGTMKKVVSPDRSGFLPLLCEAGSMFSFGSFTILPFEVKHDAAEPLGFLIKHSETGIILFATDTYFLPNRFEGLNNILIEANYRTDILEARKEAGGLPAALYHRTLESHMSFETCMEALQANDLSKVNNIVLIHLSDGNSHAEQFKRDAHQKTGKTVWIADKGLRINFDKTPF